MGAEEKDNELTDVALCYQALGMALDASPAQLDQTYKALTEQYRRRLASPDPAEKEEAKRSIELLNEMYDKIRGSVTYRAMEKEYLKRGPDTVATRQAPVKRPVHQAVLEQKRMVLCPRCNGSIHKGVKTCPICKAPVYTLPQRILRSVFSPAKIVIYCLILIAGSVALYRYLHAESPKDSLPDFDALEQKAPAK